MRLSWTKSYDYSSPFSFDEHCGLLAMITVLSSYVIQIFFDIFSNEISSGAGLYTY